MQNTGWMLVMAVDGHRWHRGRAIGGAALAGGGATAMGAPRRAHAAGSTKCGVIDGGGELSGGALFYTGTMFRRLRIVLSCLLALAIPVQGFTAMTLLLCAGAVHHAPARMAPSGADHGHHDGHDHGGGHLASMAHGAGSLAEPVGGGHQATVDGQPDGGCPACAACCTAVAMPSHGLALPELRLRPPMVAVLVMPAAVFLTEGPERPPRSPRA